ncbi:uncharacterized protein LOC34620937 [Cyclospora cayetanensis]|uniref:Uncharacterized protein LOC34620937 n=1 Tax=Cyclospora cayetanensis TaxID=88456 RepID=A0A6P6RTR8_9EIME|nr:uncharacterized protein LOC34620937 [Cyclospora cayetanensis]
MPGVADPEAALASPNSGWQSRQATVQALRSFLTGSFENWFSTGATVIRVFSLVVGNALTGLSGQILPQLSIASGASRPQTASQFARQAGALCTNAWDARPPVRVIWPLTSFSAPPLCPMPVSASAGASAPLYSPLSRSRGCLKALGSVATPHATPPSPVVPEPPVIGKCELLAWVNQVLADTGESVEFSSLRFGDVLLRLFSLIWPAVLLRVEQEAKLHPKTAADVSTNWELIEWALQCVGVPSHFVNRQLIAEEDFGACYEALVFLYFLFSLATHHECEFVLAHPVANALTEFMSSEAPLACLVAGGAVHVPKPIKEKILTPKNTPRLTERQEELLKGTSEIQLGAVAATAEGAAFGVSGTTPPSPLPADPPEQPHLQLQRPLERQDSALQASPSPCVMPPARAAGRAFTLTPPPAAGVSQSPPRVVGGAFASDGTFCSGSAGETSTRPLTAERRDVRVQTEAWSGEGQKLKGEQLLEMLQYQCELLQQQLQQAVEEADTARRQHAQALQDGKEAADLRLNRERETYRSQLLDLQTKHAAALQAMRYQHDMKIRQIEDDVTIDIEVLTSRSSLTGPRPSTRAKEELQKKQRQEAASGYPVSTSSEAQPHSQQSASASASQEAAMAKVQKLEELMTERLRARDLAANETKMLLQDTLQQVADYKQESDARWNQWRRCEAIRQSILQFATHAEGLPPMPKRLGQAGTPPQGDALAPSRHVINMQVQQIVEQSGISVPQVSPLEQKLLTALAELLYMQHAQQSRHRQRELELTRLLHQCQQGRKGTSGACAGKATLAEMGKEVLLEEQVRRLESQNQRLLRTSEYLRLKVEHVGKWRAEDALSTQQQQPQQQQDGKPEGGSSGKPSTASETEGAEVLQLTRGSSEAGVASGMLMLREDDATIERDAELLHVLKGLHRHHHDSRFTDAAEAELQTGSLRNVEEAADICISYQTKKRLVQLFWMFLGDFYRFRARLEEGDRQVRLMQHLVHEGTQAKLALEQEAARIMTEKVSCYEQKLQKERTHYQRTLGRTLVKLLAAQEHLDILTQSKKKLEEDHEALLQVLHQADHKRFNVMLNKLHSVEMTNRILQKREHFWNQLAKALSSQLRSPSESSQRAIQDLWSQLMGSKVLLNSDSLQLSADSTAPQQVQEDLVKLSKETGNSIAVTRRAGRRPSTGGNNNPTALRDRQLGRSSSRANAKNFTQSSSSSTSAVPTDSVTSSATAKRDARRARETPAAGAPENGEPQTAEDLDCADSFAQCLREICCQQGADEQLSEALSSAKGSWKTAFEWIQQTSDMEEEEEEEEEPEGDLSSGAGARPSTLRLLKAHLLKANEAGSEGDGMPKDWLALLKAMIQEAMALFRKHRALRDKEISAIAPHLHACVSVHRPPSCLFASVNVTTQRPGDAVRLPPGAENILPETALERLQRDKAQLEQQEKAAQDALRAETAMLRAGQKETHQVLKTVATHATDIPFIVSLCKNFLAQAAVASLQEGAAHPAFTETSREEIAPESDTSNAEGTANVTCAARQHLEEGHLERGDYEMTALVLPLAPRPPSPRTPPPVSVAAQAPLQPLKQHEVDDSEAGDIWKTPALLRKDSWRNGFQVDTRASTNDAAECEVPPSSRCGNGVRQGPLGSLPSRSVKGNAASSDRSERSLAGEKETARVFASFSESRGSGCSNNSNARRAAKPPEDDSDDMCGLEDIHRIPSTTLPTPRSPPKASLAPLLSPSRLVQALRMQAQVPKSTGEVSTTNTIACQPPSAKSTSSPEADDRGRAQRQLTDARESEAESLKTQDGFFNLDSKQDGRRTRHSRAAAEQAWEAFVGEYGLPRRNKVHSPTSATHSRRLHSWRSAYTPSSKGGESSLLERSSAVHQIQGRQRGIECERMTLGGREAMEDGEEEEHDGHFGVLTRESTDCSVLQDVLNIERGLLDEEIDGGGPLFKESAQKGLPFGNEKRAALLSDDPAQLGVSTSAFLRRLGSQLETRMQARVSCNRKTSHLN